MAVNQWHNIRSLVLQGLSDNGPHLADLKNFCRTFRAAYGAHIVMGGSKHTLVWRIVDKLTEYEESENVEAWQVAY
ncbi:hypothetical protein C8F04DRAFT_1253942 [Mycena alexandri]|uniref:Uncharacterized protein n=1 Tax=Mycena alexandri TaxID=1745969 RepID=A0AAD6T6B7_9AGAR|nr:hypothetical protein C8F04DRAFT_1253942 [Mycena alexandri]